MKKAGIPVVVLLVSGRPMIVTNPLFPFGYGLSY